MTNKIPSIKRVRILITCMFLSLSFSGQSNVTKPPLQLATIYPAKDNHAEFKIKQYWISEKLDGIRGYWTGSKLFTRQGHLINTPQNFTKNWPNESLEGELWIDRNRFEQVSGIVRRKVVKTDDWQEIRFMVFDLPNNKKNFTERLQVMASLVAKSNSTTIAMIEQKKVNSTNELKILLNQIVNAQGEGLMLHHQDAFYKTGRNSHLLKLKKHYDSEAKVIAHLEGKGKYKGKMGALIVTTVEGITFKIGTGFNDQQRMTPPPVGCIITFKYFGKSQKGVPRFASFMRVRHSKEQFIN